MYLVPHDGQTHFLGYFTIDIQHKTSPDVIPTSFYVFEYSTRPFTLLSYPASIHLGIMEFKAPNEASSHTLVDSITDRSNIKQVSFSTPLHSSTTTKKAPTQRPKLKPALKQKQHQRSAFQDHNALKVSSLQYHKSPFQDHSSPRNHLLQDHFSDISVKDVQDIVSLKKAFPKSFDTIGKHAWRVHTSTSTLPSPKYNTQKRKVPIECKEAIEKLLQDMVDKALSPQSLSLWNGCHL